MKRAYGFTIVELLIVIVVIAILAAISVVAYNNFTVQASDTRVREGAAQFEKALYLWAAESPDPRPLGNSGATTSGVVNGNCSNGSGAGFVASGRYACATEDILHDADYLPAGFVGSLPRNIYFGGRQDGGQSIMLYRCGANTGRYVLLWSLQAPTAEETANLDSIASSCGAAANPRDNYGMRAARIVQL